jgi:hypothetical protein
MPVLRIQTHLESDRPHLPELGPLVGKDVEITVREDSAPPAPMSEAQITELRGLLANLDYDFDAVDQLRRMSTL